MKQQKRFYQNMTRRHVAIFFTTVLSAQYRDPLENAVAGREPSANGIRQPPPQQRLRAPSVFDAGTFPVTSTSPEANAPSRPPMSFPLEALLAPDRNRALDEWASSKLRDNGGPSAPSLPTPNLPASNLPAPSVFDQGTAPVSYIQDAAQDAPGGLLGRLMRMSAFDPSDPDPPPAGGLLALIQQSIRNNPDGGATR